MRSRRGLDPSEVRRLSSRVEEKVLSLPEFVAAKTVASYVAKKDEVQTDGIIRAALARGKRVLVPRTNAALASLSFHRIEGMDDLRPGYFGVFEPPEGSPSVPLSQSDMILVPVVAWDGEGRRIGYGRGFFDRELRSRGRAPGVGLAFESQQREGIPSEPIDVPLDMIVTEQRVIRFGRVEN